MDTFFAIESLSQIIDWGGVLIIIVGVLFASIHFALNCLHTYAYNKAFILYRRNLARIILLGLEFLIAGDIIRSVGETPTFEKVSVLGIIVIIRTFLSLELQMEVDGKLPWQKKQKNTV